jgi:hypothetical protein
LALLLYGVQGVCAASWPLSRTAEKKQEKHNYSRALIKIAFRTQSTVQNIREQTNRTKMAYTE